MLEAVGVKAVTSGGGIFFVKPPLYPDQQMAFTDDLVDHVNPFCIAAMEDVTGLGLTGGEAGTILTIMESAYRVLSIEPENSGFFALELGNVS